MSFFMALTISMVLFLIPEAQAADVLSGAVDKQPLNITAIIMFFAFVAGTMGITYWASKKTTSSSDFYTAGGGITGFQNGMAIAGDFMSAASFLGLSGMIYLHGVDALIYTVGWTIGWPVLLFLIAERLRNLGKFTFADVVSYRLAQVPVRLLAASGSLIVVLFYLIAQMVGAGKLIQLLFGLDYAYAVVLVNILMLCYVLFGGMLATTWVQIIKAGLLLAGVSLMAVLGLLAFNFDFGLVMQKAVENHPQHRAILDLSAAMDNWFVTISLGLSLVFGLAGLPHILMRFFTVPDAKEARKSVLYATGFIGYFYVVIILIGFLSITLVGTDPVFRDAAGKILGGNNMVAVHLAKQVGGNAFLGFISAVAFATILAVVSGLALAGASAVSHDLYARVFRKGRTTEREEMLVSRTAVVVLSLIGLVLGLAFENQNIAFMVSLAFGVAASVNFPVLLLSILWKGLTTRGAVIGGFVGLVVSILCVVLGPAVWVGVFGFAAPIFPYEQYALLSMGLAFAGIWLFSITDRSERAKIDRAGFAHQRVRSETGLGADGAVAH